MVTQWLIYISFLLETDDEKIREFLEVLQEWENAIGEYKSQSGQPFTPNMMVSVVSRWVPEEVKATIRQHSTSIGEDYEKLRNLIRAYVTSGHTYGPDGHVVAGAAGSSATPSLSGVSSAFA